MQQGRSRKTFNISSIRLLGRFDAHLETIKAGEMAILNIQNSNHHRDQAISVRMEGMVPKVGLEPTYRCRWRILNPLRLPFRHLGMCVRYIYVPTR
jgi:hypothetical protein